MGLSPRRRMLHEPALAIVRDVLATERAAQLPATEPLPLLTAAVARARGVPWPEASVANPIHTYTYLAAADTLHREAVR